MRRVADLVIYRKSKYFSEEKAFTTGALSKELGISPLLERALRARGAETREQIERFLSPSVRHFHDPFLLNDMQRAVDRINLALDTGERICIFGDYDVDGICATAMLTDYFRCIGADVVYHIPSRSEEGYGMSTAAIEKLYQQGVGLIITVDNGISAASEIDRCSELGMDVIVTDHHIPPERIPECAAVVSHTVPGSRYPTSILCGAGTAFKLVHALAGVDAAMKYVSLAGLASVADVVPLVDENRIFVKLGLEAINEGRCCFGLSRLLESIPTTKKPYNTCNLGFAVAPRLNASGRMSDASLSVELFLSSNLRDMDGIIAELNRLNELRQKDEAGILSDALEMLSARDLSDTRAIVLCKKEWNGGVIGIAASRILEMFHRPTILLCESGGVLKGSARSIDGVNIHDALIAVKDCFLRFGGHAKAAGITMEQDRLEEFEARLNEHLKNSFEDSAFAARKDYEFEIPVSAVNAELIREISMLAPFGESNPSPVFRSKGVEIGRIRRFGNDSQHTRFDVFCEGGCLEAVWFGSAPYFKGLLSAEKLDVLYSPTVNTWCGSEGIQLRVKWAQAQLPSDTAAFIENGLWNFCDAYVENACYPPSAAPICVEECAMSLKELYSSGLSGIMAIAFSPECAKAAIDEIRASGICVDICFGGPPESAVCDNVLVIAPKLHALPASGYGTIAILDAPPFEGTLEALEARQKRARLIRLSGFMPDAERAFDSVAACFTAERDFMTECYSTAMNALSTGLISFEELTCKLSERTKAPKYCSRFAIRVFVELGFVRVNGRGTLETATIVPTCLSNSRLYSAVAEAQGIKSGRKNGE